VKAGSVFWVTQLLQVRARQCLWVARAACAACTDTKLLALPGGPWIPQCNRCVAQFVMSPLRTWMAMVRLQLLLFGHLHLEVASV
jgi:hypothetical protein